jgi:hypothetical protein
MNPETLPIIAGRKRAIINTIMQETLANIYLPHLLQMDAQSGSPNLQISDGVVYITGQSHSIAKAKDQMNAVFNRKKSSMMTMSVPCISRKLDWMLVNRRDQLRKIMNDNGVFLSIPPIGSNIGSIRVIGDDPIFVERSIRSLMVLACEYYICSIQVSMLPSSSPTTTNNNFSSVCDSSKSEIFIHKNNIEVCGTQYSSKLGLRKVLELGFLLNMIKEVKFRIELGLVHKEFINGKKNGKINKIIKTSGCKIIFLENLNAYNMIIDTIHPIPSRVLEGLEMLEDELPAEISFYVPEAYHKRIIGVGGKNIQRIMKKYGVYVKFSNAEEFASLGGYFENMDNVIARTPAKNAVNLNELKEAIMELVVVNEGPMTSLSLSIPWQLHRSITAGPRGLNVEEYENMYGVKISIPDREMGIDNITITGPETQVHQTRAQIMQLIPDLHDFQIPASQTAIYVLKSPEFQESVCMRISQEFGIELNVHVPAVEDIPNQECTFILQVGRGNTNLDRAKKVIFDYLTIKQVPLQAQPSLQKSGSYANLAPNKSYDSFQHFNSKLLSPATSGTYT